MDLSFNAFDLFKSISYSANFLAIYYCALSYSEGNIPLLEFSIAILACDTDTFAGKCYEFLDLYLELQSTLTLLIPSKKTQINLEMAPNCCVR